MNSKHRSGKTTPKKMVNVTLVGDDPLMTTKKWEERNVWIFYMSEGAVNEFGSIETRDGDVLLASVMKTGTTWMKSLLHSIVCTVNSVPDDLDKYSPHDIVPTIELLYKHHGMSTAATTARRLMATHLPLHALPDAFKTDSVKIVCVTRNPRDAFVSQYKFWESYNTKELSFFDDAAMSKDAMFESYIAGRFHGGPFAENVLGYLEASRKRPRNVLFVTYEDMVSDIEDVVCKVGSFLGYSEEFMCANAFAISQRCSLGSLKSLDANKDGVVVTSMVGAYKRLNASLFRNGKVGEWKEHFTPQMVEGIQLHIERKLEEHGLQFDYS